MPKVGDVKVVNLDEFIGYLGNDKWLYLGYTESDDIKKATVKFKKLFADYLTQKRAENTDATPPF